MKEATEVAGLASAGTYGTRAAGAAILAGQRPNGAIVASPDFPQYQYCWLRDGSFIAHALDRAGQHDAAERFHRWCASAIDRITPLMSDAGAHPISDRTNSMAQMPPARFSLDGAVVADDWPNFQVDGYGTWLWSVHQHLQTSGTPMPSWLAPVVRATADYLSEVGTSPCYDPWEEHGDWVHTATLGCVWAGITAASTMLNDDGLAERAAAIKGSLLDQARVDGYFRKADRSQLVDGATLWICEPLQLVPASEAAFVETVGRVMEELDLEGGTRRYATDTYYGGGAWPVLTASLGLCHVAAGDIGAAERCCEWISGHVDKAGRLAEQFGGKKRDPVHYREWMENWGPPAADLLWSHAMYILLRSEISSARGGVAKPNSD